jgi:hypothetical protein
MYSLQTSLKTNLSIGFVRIEIILVTQYCHCYERYEFQQHHQITFSMITTHQECLIDHNLISLQFLHRTDLTIYLFSYFAFLRSVHSPTFCSFYILCVAQTMVNYKLPPTCLLGMSASLVDVLKSNFSCLYFEFQQPPKGSFSCHNL